MELRGDLSPTTIFPCRLDKKPTALDISKYLAGPLMASEDFMFNCGVFAGLNGRDMGWVMAQCKNLAAEIRRLEHASTKRGQRLRLK